MFISFSNGSGSAFENSLNSGRISFRKRPCAMYKDNALGNVVAETGRDLLSLWDYGATERSFNAIDRRGSTLTWTVCKAIGGSR